MFQHQQQILFDRAASFSVTMPYTISSFSKIVYSHHYQPHGIYISVA